MSPPRWEVVIGNNAALVEVYGSLLNHKKEDHPNLIVIIPDDWMKHLHRDHHNNRWGQNANSFPRLARIILGELYPERNPEDFVTWSEVQALRREILHRIKSYNVPLCYGRPMIKRLSTGQFDIQIPSSFAIEAPKDTHFYLWYHEPRIVNNAPASTDLYQVALDDLPKNKDIIVYGAGLSVAWLRRFIATEGSGRRIVCLSEPGGFVQQIPKIPSNIDIPLEDICYVDIDDATIEWLSSESNAVRVTSGDGQLFDGFIYSAAGYISPEEIVKEVPEEQLTTHSQWMPQEFIAPENLARGGLMPSVLEFIDSTENESFPPELQAYHEHKHPLRGLKTPLNKEFRDEFKRRVKALPNILPDDQFVEFAADIYHKVYQCSPEVVGKFKEELWSLADDLQSRSTFSPRL
jgi:hypothetical protein